jgi:hypothetical protein
MNKELASVGCLFHDPAHRPIMVYVAVTQDEVVEARGIETEDLGVVGKDVLAASKIIKQAGDSLPRGHFHPER